MAVFEVFGAADELEVGYFIIFIMDALQAQLVAMQAALEEQRRIVQAQQEHLAQRDESYRQVREELIRAATETRTANERAEEDRRERRAVLDLVANRDIVDTKGVGQPPKFDGTPGGKGSVDWRMAPQVLRLRPGQVRSRYREGHDVDRHAEEPHREGAPRRHGSSE